VVVKMADTLDLPVVYLAPLLTCLAAGRAPAEDESVLAAARTTADALHRLGLLCVRDPRADAGPVSNDVFLDTMERYFGQADAVKDEDIRADIWYQLGRTPSRVELPRNHCTRVNEMPLGHRPATLCPPEKDPKERYMYRIGPRPEVTAFPQLNSPPVLPAGFSEWSSVMEGWGATLLSAAEGVAMLAAIGFGLPHDAFTSRMMMGPHLLAPTASDFSKFGSLGTVLAGFHYDLNFITSHGASRYPGLYVETRAGERKAVRMAKGCLLVQAGKQFEHLTGGHVLAGFHEVVVSPATVEAIAAAKAADRSLWRISSTLFSHIASDVLLQPLTPAWAAEGGERYPPISAGDHVAAELAAINLADGDGAAPAQ